jgi:hypothetical protein
MEPSLRTAELGLRGVVVKNCKNLPRRCGRPAKARHRIKINPGAATLKARPQSLEAKVS